MSVDLNTPDRVTTADAAFPFDYSRLPAGVDVILGYIGQPGETPHIWTAGQVAAVRATGRAWAPIHTVPPHGLDEQSGMQAGNMTIAELAGYDYPPDGPVFLDVEHVTYADNPAAAMAGVHAWQHVVTSHRPGRAIPYLPAAAGYGWAAHWGADPSAPFPPDVVGLQYAGGVDGDRYDLSTFDRDVFAPLLDDGGPVMAGLTDADKRWIVAQLRNLQQNVFDHARWDYDDDDPKHPRPHANRHLHAGIDALAQQIDGLGAGGVDVDKLAAALAGQLADGLARHVADVLSARLAK